MKNENNQFVNAAASSTAQVIGGCVKLSIQQSDRAVCVLCCSPDVDCESLECFLMSTPTKRSHRVPNFFPFFLGDLVQMTKWTRKYLCDTILFTHLQCFKEIPRVSVEAGGSTDGICEIHSFQLCIGVVPSQAGRNWASRPVVWTQPENLDRQNSTKCSSLV